MGVPLEVLLITANGSRNLVSTIDTNFKIGPSHSSTEKFNINQALVMDELPSIEQSFPTHDNLRFFKNTANLLIRDNKFPKLADTRLHLIIGVRQAELIHYEKLENLPTLESICKKNGNLVGLLSEMTHIQNLDP